MSGRSFRSAGAIKTQSGEENSSSGRLKTVGSLQQSGCLGSDPSKKSLREWSKRCTERDPDKRPNMADFVRQF